MKSLKRSCRLALHLFRWLKNSLLPNRQSAAEAYSFLLSDVFQHSCKTPLSVLICSLESIQEEELQVGTKRIARSYQAAKSLKHLLTCIANPEEMNDKVFDASAAIDEIVVLTKGKYPDCHITNRVPNALITGNMLYFQEAVQCLLNNALEAFEDREATAEVLISGVVTSKHLRFDIIDFGEGMTAAEVKLALLKGISYKKSGSGLGLPFAKDIFERQFKGDVQVVSGSRLGTRVVVHLPL